MLTRSQRIPHENLRLRDADYVERYEDWIARTRSRRRACRRRRLARSIPPMFTPFRAARRRAQEPDRRIADGAVLGAGRHSGRLPSGAPRRARDGRRRHGLRRDDLRVARRTDHAGCPGLWNDAQRDAWRRIVAFVHARDRREDRDAARARGREGFDLVPGRRRGSTVAHGNWPLVSASAQQYLAGISQTARAATREDMARIKADFVRATRRAAEAGFDWLELHCAHGYLLSCFISPLTNRRDDEYGGDLAGRCRYPLEVFAAVRAAWPADKPISVRISAHDWAEGGITPTTRLTSAGCSRRPART